MKNYSKATTLFSGRCSASVTRGVTCHAAQIVNERYSAVSLAMRRPCSWRKTNADSPTAPRVSTAMAVKSYSGDRLLRPTLTSFFLDLVHNYTGTHDSPVQVA